MGVSDFTREDAPSWIDCWMVCCLPCSEDRFDCRANFWVVGLFGRKGREASGIASSMPLERRPVLRMHSFCSWNGRD